MSLLVPLVANSQETVGEGEFSEERKDRRFFQMLSSSTSETGNLVHWFSGMDKGTGPHLVQKELLPTSGRADELASFLRL